MAELRKIVIDGKEIEADPNLTLIQVCEESGIEIPRFCYHERLSIAGNCRMCLVEPVGAPKPAAACHMTVRDMRGGPDGEPPELRTDSPMVRKAREGAMEFLLINHPLDCPICDQGGECDLQDQAMAYGVDFSRFREAKRAATDLDLGPLVETHMTRCISCTRCVRFITEVAGVAELGQTGRGEDSEITAYLGEILESEMQGNIVDLCPVGALTNKPYAFTARPWELTGTQSVDVMDALGSNIRIDARGREVMRILPRNHDGVNEEWLADRSRHIADGLRRQRLDRPYLRIGGMLKPVSWEEAFAAVAQAIKPAQNKSTGGKRAKGKIAAVAGDLVPVEAMWALKKLMKSLGSDQFECRQDGAQLPMGNRSAYVGTAKVADLDTAKKILLIGANPRNEAPVLNARIRKAWLAGGAVAAIGSPADLTYPVNLLGTGPEALEGEERKRARSHMSGAGGKVIVIGQGALRREDGAAVLAAAMALANETKAKLMVLHTAAARVGGMDIGFANPGGIGCLQDADVVWNLGADECEMPEGAFVVYQGHHGDRGAHRADVILPSAAWTEQPGIYVNTEGRVQTAARAGFPPGEAREDWAILRAVSEKFGKPLPFNSLEELRAGLFKEHPHLAQADDIVECKWTPLPTGSMKAEPFAEALGDHYLTNPITRASETMAEMSRLARERARARSTKGVAERG